MVASSALSLFSLNRANNGMQDIIHNDYPTTVKANQLIDNFQSFVSTQQLMLLDTDGKWQAETEKQLGEISSRVTVLLDDLTKNLHDSESQKSSPRLKISVSNFWTRVFVFWKT
jgi:methyl-accepting chemotaxis protein-2 (aspartate sensor receptor)